MRQPVLSVTFNCQVYFKVEKKVLSKDNMRQVVLYLDLNLLEIFSNNMYIKPYVLLL